MSLRADAARTAAAALEAVAAACTAARGSTANPVVPQGLRLAPGVQGASGDRRKHRWLSCSQLALHRMPHTCTVVVQARLPVALLLQVAAIPAAAALGLLLARQ
jgi:hypothetical protein